MLDSNGRTPKIKNNYHMKQSELVILLNYVREHYDSKWPLAIMLQYGMGLRASEMLAIQIWDFKKKFSYLNYRQAKTNKMIYNEPVPEPISQAVITYIEKNKHRLRTGYLFPTYTGRGYHMSYESYGSQWSAWRQALGKKYPGFLDCYYFGHQKRYRISSHSLRRLHRTTLVKKYPDRLYDVMIMCNYEDFSSFKRYINDFDIQDKKDEYLMSVFNPSLQYVTLFAEGQEKLSKFGF